MCICMERAGGGGAQRMSVVQSRKGKRGSLSGYRGLGGEGARVVRVVRWYGWHGCVGGGKGCGSDGGLTIMCVGRERVVWWLGVMVCTYGGDR